MFSEPDAAVQEKENVRDQKNEYGQGNEQSQEAQSPGGVRAFLKRKDIEFSFQRYAIDALAGMAQGLFASLLIGTIFATLGDLTHIETLGTIGAFAKSVAGPAMAIAIGYALKTPPLVLFSLAAVGYAANDLGGAGGPLAVLLIAIVAAEAGKAVSKETKVDILVTPGFTILVGAVLSILCAPAIGAAASSVGAFIMWATELHPIAMGMLVSAVVGIALTLPISSAAICAALGLTGLAGGAALAGCCAQMMGFAVMSFKDNKWGGLISQGIGTSMLQMPNIMKKPIIWLPPIIASLITGPLATAVFVLEQNGPAIASGMGTSGLVGPIGLYSGWVANGIAADAFHWLGLILICFVLPSLISWAVCEVMRKMGLIQLGDLKLPE